MNKNTIRRISAVTGTLILLVFILGLAKSISDGATGFKGGIPFWLIALFVLGLAVYDMWEEGFRKR